MKLFVNDTLHLFGLVTETVTNAVYGAGQVTESGGHQGWALARQARAVPQHICEGNESLSAFIYRERTDEASKQHFPVSGFRFGFQGPEGAQKLYGYCLTFRVSIDERDISVDNGSGQQRLWQLRAGDGGDSAEHILLMTR